MKHPHLAIEIAFALVVKAAFIWLLWSLFFSHPVDDRLDGAGVASSFLDAARDRPSITTPEKVQPW